jgi:hypothetical protein
MTETELNTVLDVRSENEHIHQPWRIDAGQTVD